MTPADFFTLGVSGEPWPEARLEALRGTSADWHHVYASCARAWLRGEMWHRAGVDPRALPPPRPGERVLVLTDSPWCLDEQLARAAAAHPGVPVALAVVPDARPVMGLVPADWRPRIAKGAGPA